MPVRRFLCVIQVIAWLVAAKCGEKTAKTHVIYGISMCYSGDYIVGFGCLDTYNGCSQSCSGVCEFVCSENVMWKRRNGDALQRVDAWFTAFWFQKVAKTYSVAAFAWCNSAFATLKSAKSCVFSANTVQISCIFVYKMANLWCDFGVWQHIQAVSMCYSGNYIVCFRRKRGAKSAKMYAISAIWQHIQAVSMCYSGDYIVGFGCSEEYNGGFLSDYGEMVVLCGGFMVRKWLLAI